MDSAEIRHEAGAGPHSETVMAPGHRVWVLIKPAQLRQTGYETGTGHTVWVLIKPAQCVKQGMKLALATQSGS